jgi:NADP-dependent 3-hydroxy acid dehydrogenase YdfG
MNQRTVLITGSSSGIGAAFAEVFASEGFDLVITARREDRLHALAASLAKRYHCRVHVVVSDLSAVDASARLCDNLASNGIVIDALVNKCWLRCARRIPRVRVDAACGIAPSHGRGVGRADAHPAARDD